MKKKVQHKRCTIGSKTPELEGEKAIKKEFYSHLTLSGSDTFSFGNVPLNRFLPCSSTNNCLRPSIQCLNKRTAVEKAVQPHTFVFCKEKKNSVHDDLSITQSINCCGVITQAVMMKI